MTLFDSALQNTMRRTRISAAASAGGELLITHRVPYVFNRFTNMSTPSTMIIHGIGIHAQNADAGGITLSLSDASLALPPNP